MPLEAEQWKSTIVEHANGDDRFETATAQFDGSVTFEIGQLILWFKIYRGRIIDTETYVPFFGATFRVEGKPEAWKKLVDGNTSFTEQVRRGNLHIRGNKLEANRMRDATELMIRCLPEHTEEADV